MAKKIVGMTKKYGDWPNIVARKMMVRYANEDWNYDVVGYIDETIRVMGDRNSKEWEPARHKLNYWKYLFMLAKGNKTEAMYHLRKSYEEHGADATAQYGYFYYTGQEVTNVVNRNKAKRLFEYALSQDSMFAEYLYANAILYKRENDLEAIKAAIPYYEVALKKGAVFARYKLANCYLKSEQKLDEAIKLFGKCDEADAKMKIEEAKRLKNKRR